MWMGVRVRIERVRALRRSWPPPSRWFPGRRSGAGGGRGMLRELSVCGICGEVPLAIAIENKAKGPMRCTSAIGVFFKPNDMSDEPGR